MDRFGDLCDLYHRDGRNAFLAGLLCAPPPHLPVWLARAWVGGWVAASGETINHGLPAS